MIQSTITHCIVEITEFYCHDIVEKNSVKSTVYYRSFLEIDLTEKMRSSEFLAFQDKCKKFL